MRYGLSAVFCAAEIDERCICYAGGYAAMTNTSIVAKVYGGDYKYAAMLTVVSTLLAVITTRFICGCCVVRSVRLIAETFALKP